jgi:glutamyl-tRNA synthetase
MESSGIKPRAVPRGRLAPSPTGLVHLGNARTALVAWLSVRSRGGRLVWRLEDLDAPRAVAGMADAAERDLGWIGLDWDEGPSRGGRFGPYAQSQRRAFYDQALAQLQRAGRVFPCPLSRRDLEGLASAPHGPACEAAYPRSLRPASVDEAWLNALRTGERRDAAIRFRVAPGRTTFHDRIRGSVSEDVEASVGDFVLRRRDGLYAYQLAVVVDDMLMEIDDVVRGADLLDSTARQIQLIEALGGTIPDYAHVGLVRNHDGEKLSKRDSGLTLRALRAAGVAPEQVVGYLAASLGLLDRAQGCAPSDLIDGFGYHRLSSSDLVLPPDAPGAMRTV